MDYEQFINVHVCAVCKKIAYSGNYVTVKILYSPIICSKITCKDAGEDDVSVSSDSLGEQLFELVNVYNTGHSQKITGKQTILRTSTSKNE